MTRFQHYAVYQLGVVALTAVAVGVILYVTGNILGALAGFGLLGATGIGEMYWRRGQRRLPEDERDEHIARRAGAVAYAVFWICFVLWGTAITLRFAGGGEVPIAFVAPAVCVAWWLVIAVRSAAILALNARGA